MVSQIVIPTLTGIASALTKANKDKKENKVDDIGSSALMNNFSKVMGYSGMALMSFLIGYDGAPKTKDITIKKTLDPEFIGPPAEEQTYIKTVETTISDKVRSGLYSSGAGLSGLYLATEGQGILAEGTGTGIIGVMLLSPTLRDLLKPIEGSAWDSWEESQRTVGGHDTLDILNYILTLINQGKK
tara:strand:+ start:462 stop:1019 length:558 start_codon:yes stop_codon:yes gene_type:complete